MKDNFLCIGFILMIFGLSLLFSSFVYPQIGVPMGVGAGVVVLGSALSVPIATWEFMDMIFKG